jgi:hypothetical protein
MPPLKRRPANRLPAYYSKVISQDQREKVLGVNKEYNTKITKLRDDLKALVAARDAALESLLTAEQKEKLKKLKAEAKLKTAQTAK